MTTKKYKIIYADPPWQYKSRMALGKGASKSSAEDYYSVLSVEDIASLPINELADRDCILFLWVTMPKLFEAQKVIEGWGFEYKTCAFVWVKRNKVFSQKRYEERGIDDFMGQGRWTRGNAELCLLATKGSPKRISAKIRQIVHTPIKKHSQKPDEVRERIVELIGNVNRIELFARDKKEGWDAWGNEVDSDIKLRDQLIR